MVVNDEPVHAHADLALMEKPPEYGRVDGVIQVRIVEDDKWGVAQGVAP
jgi:hypothetical protein